MGKRRLWRRSCGGDGDAVVAAPAGGAVARLGAAHAADQAFEGEVAERVGFDEGADLLDRLLRRDELGAARGVDAVVAGPAGRRRGDAQVDLGGAGLAHHAHDLPRGRAAHDRVVDQHDPLAGDDRAHRVQLHLDAEVADRLLGLDERPADVVVARHAELERQARLAAVADRRVEAAVGHRHDDVGGGRRLARQLRAQTAPDLGHRVAEDHAVGAGEVDVLEEAARRLGLLRQPERLEPAAARRPRPRPARARAASSPPAGRRRTTPRRSSRSRSSSAIASGRKPCGSRAAIRQLSVTRSSE